MSDNEAKPETNEPITIRVRDQVCLNLILYSFYSIYMPLLYRSCRQYLLYTLR